MGGKLLLFFLVMEVDELLNEEVAPTIIKYRTRDAPLSEYREHRAYWVYKAKLSNLTDRWAEAFEHARQAVRFPVESAKLEAEELDMADEMLSPRALPGARPLNDNLESPQSRGYSPRTQTQNGRSRNAKSVQRDLKEWRVLCRAVEGRLKDLRRKAFAVSAFLKPERSESTRESFADLAGRRWSELLSELKQACEIGLEILQDINPTTDEGKQGVQRLRGDIFRYQQEADKSEAAYREALKGPSNKSNYTSSQTGLYFIDRNPGEIKLPVAGADLKPHHIQLLPVNLNQLYKSQATKRVEIPFSPEEFKAPPISAP